MKYGYLYETDRERSFTDPGDPVHIIYEGQVSKDGSIELVATGKQYIPDLINSHKESCDINNIVNRYLNGDSSVLDVNSLSFGDFTDLPHDPIGMVNYLKQAERDFDSLPIEVRDKFNHNYYEYLQQAGTDSWYDKLGISVDAEKVNTSDSSEIKEVANES